MVFGILLFIFIVVCILLCLLILIQSDKGGGISGAIGGLSGANNFLGSQDTANVLTKGTYIFGSVFLLLCVLMTFFAPSGGAPSESALQRRAQQGGQRTVTQIPMGAAGAMFADEEAASPFEMDAAGAGAVEAGEQPAAEPAAVTGDDPFAP